MEIKSKYKSFNPLSFFSKLKRNTWIILIGLGLPVLLAIVFIFGAYSYREKPGVFQNALYSLNNIPSVSHYFLWNKPIPEQLSIDIKFKHLQKLAYKKKVANEIGYLNTLDADEGYVPIKITYQNKTVDAKARLKGNDPDARRGDRWSLRIKVKDGETIMGMKVFSIHDPKVKNSLSEWIFHKLLEYNNLISLRYKFVEIAINGDSDGIYAVEENFDKRLIEDNRLREGIILRFDEYWNYYFHYSQDFSSWENYKNKFYSMAPIDAFGTKRIAQDSSLNSQFSKAKNMLESYRQGKLKVNETFDLKKIAKFFAITDLLGRHHALEMRNIRFYYNPITRLIEPIGFDHHVGIQKLKGLIGKGRQLGKENEKESLALWENSFFKDTLFYKEYIKCLNEFANPDYLNGFFENINSEYQTNINLLYRNDFRFEDDSPGIMKYNQGYFQRVLDPIKGIEVYYSDLRNDSITIQIGNFHPLPVEIQSITLNGKQLSDSNVRGQVIPAKADYILMKFKAFRIGLDHGVLSNATIDSLKVNCTILGLHKRISESIRHYSFYDQEFLKTDFISSKPNIKDFDLFNIDEVKKIIQIKPGSHKITNNIIIPSGYQVFCPEGVTLDLINTSTILSYSSFQFFGRKDNPIIVQSSDSTGQGITIIDSKDSCRFDYVRFENLSNPSKIGWQLTGSLTFYESPVFFTNCEFRNNIAGDDFLNIMRSEFVIQNSLFTAINADAFDSDFSNGSISKTNFFDIGNDAIDISGTQLSMSNILIKKVGDKGISVGEKSNLTGSNIEIYNSDKAVASKDFSEVNLNNTLIKDCNIGLTAFQKKTEYGPSVIVSAESRMENVITPFLVEEKSQVSYNGSLIKSETKNLKELLYEVKNDSVK